MRRLTMISITLLLISWVLLTIGVIVRTCGLDDTMLMTSTRVMIVISGTFFSVVAVVALYKLWRIQ